MPFEKTKILIELPMKLVREVKAAAALDGIHVKHWWAEAGKAHLHRDKKDRPTSSESEE